MRRTESCDYFPNSPPAAGSQTPPELWHLFEARLGPPPTFSLTKDRSDSTCSRSSWRRTAPSTLSVMTDGGSGQTLLSAVSKDLRSAHGQANVCASETF